MLKHERLMFFFAQRIRICMNLLWKYITHVYIRIYCTYMFRTPQEKSPFPILHPQLLQFFFPTFPNIWVTPTSPKGCDVLQKNSCWWFGDLSRTSDLQKPGNLAHPKYPDPSKVASFSGPQNTTASYTVHSPETIGGSNKWSLGQEKKHRSSNHQEDLFLTRDLWTALQAGRCYRGVAEGHRVVFMWQTFDFLGARMGGGIFLARHMWHVRV